MPALAGPGLAFVLSVFGVWLNDQLLVGAAGMQPSSCIRSKRSPTACSASSDRSPVPVFVIVKEVEGRV
jgi:hypothetical protein